MRRSPAGWLAAAATVATGLLYAAPFLPEAARHSLAWPIRLNGEGPSLTTYGKWWILPPHRYVVDGFSGEFPTYYNYLSDTLLNLLAAPFGWAPMTVQAALWGPLLAALLLALNYASVKAATGDAPTALLAAGIVSLGAGSGLPRLLPGVDAVQLDRTLHVPFHTVSLGTAQSLGWVLLLPCLALLHRARERFTVPRAVAFGAATGLLVHAHTLTLVNAAFAQLVYLTVSLSPRLEGQRRRRWLAALAATAVAFGLRAALGPPLTSGVLVAFGGLALLVNLAADRDRRVYLWGYGTAALVAAPYALALLRDPAGVARIGEQTRPAAVAPVELIAYFLPLVLAGALAFRRAVEASARRFFLSVLLATLLLALNHLWGWGNHPYRFAIHLLFPLGALAAMGLRRAPLWAAVPLGLWILGGMAGNVRGFLAGERLYAGSVPVLPTTARFLLEVRERTAGAPPGTRLLNAPEHVYPMGLTQGALLFNYSRVPGFVPDYRYLLSRERYYNRLGLFCFLFPGYPAFDHHLDRRACAEALDPPPGLVAIREPRLRTAILPAYGIAFAGASGHPYGTVLNERQAAYGWPTLAEGDERRRLVGTPPPDLPGLARFGRSSDDGRVLPFRVEAAGPHVLVLGGRGLDRRVPRVLVDGREATGPRAGNWAVARLELSPGEHRLELPAPGLDPDGERDPLYFAAVVDEWRAADHLALPPGPGR